MILIYERIYLRCLRFLLLTPSAKPDIYGRRTDFIPLFPNQNRKSKFKNDTEWARLALAKEAHSPNSFLGSFPMTDLEQKILHALTDLDTAAKRMKTAQPKPDLGALLRSIDELTLQLPKDADPNLLHYLHRKSYEKARLCLLGREAENARGTCH
jgi:hypothetical protein